MNEKQGNAQYIAKLNLYRSAIMTFTRKTRESRSKWEVELLRKKRKTIIKTKIKKKKTQKQKEGRRRDMLRWRN